MKATLKETTTVTMPEQRIWIVGYENVSFTFRTKKAAKGFKAILDESRPTVTIRTSC